MKTRSVRIRSLAALGSLVAAAAVCAPSAEAAKSASAAQLSAITKAMQTSPVAGLKTVPRSHYKVTGAKVSTVNPNWATASLTPTKASQKTLQGGYAILALLAGTKSWVVLDFGSAEVGCGYVAANVLNDLIGKGASSACQGA